MLSKKFRTVIVISLLIFSLQFVQAQSSIKGDLNNDGKVDVIDLGILLSNWGRIDKPPADINQDGRVDIIDLGILLSNWGGTTTTTLPPGSTTGIWISKEEIKSLPISGQPGCEVGTFCDAAWQGIIAKANSNWGTPDLATYGGLSHSQGVYAGALAAVRLSFEPDRQADAQKYRDKTIQALNAIMGTEAPALPSSGGGINDGSLAIARQFPRYVIAADLLGIDNWGAGYKGYKNYVEYMANTKFTFRVGDGGHVFGENNCASNGCAMGQGARIVSAAYLNDRQKMDATWISFRRYTGDLSATKDFYFSGTGDGWYHTKIESEKLAINPKGATCAGTNYPADGVIPNDQGRGGNCPSDPNQAPGYTQYPWEGLQGAYLQAMVLKRLGYKDSAGNDPFHINDNALLRAVQYQWYLQGKFGGVWYDATRDAWVKHLSNYIYGFKPRDYAPVDGGRNMAFTQWTHQR